MLSATKHILRARPQLAPAAAKIDAIGKYGEFDGPVHKLDEIRESLINPDENVELFYMQDQKRIISMLRHRIMSECGSFNFLVYPWVGGLAASCFAIGAMNASGGWVFSAGMISCTLPFIYVFDKSAEVARLRCHRECQEILRHLHGIEEELSDGPSLSAREHQLIHHQRRLYDEYCSHLRIIEATKVAAYERELQKYSSS